MTYDSTILFSRSVSGRDWRKLGCWAFASFLIIGAVTFFDVFKPYLSSPIPVLNLQMSTGVYNLNELIGKKEKPEPHQRSYYEIKEAKPICNRSQKRSDICEMNGDIRIHGNSSTIFIASSETEILNGKENSWSIKPYARKEDGFAMGLVKELTIKISNASEGNVPDCSRKYSIPAIVFSNGGYSGNQFHTFAEILIPLYLTSIHFNGEVQLLLTDKQSRWTEKHQVVLQKFSKYELIDIDHENEVLCFPRVIVGLNTTDKELGIDPSQSSYTMKDFRKFLRSAYSLKRESVKKTTNDHHENGKRPRLLVLSRSKTRRLINTGEISDMAESLGFDVVVKETGSNESMVSKFINSFDVFVGVHGAGLTNMVYLPENAIVIQIIPFGEMEWMAKTYYEDPEREMNLQYLEYKISPSESSLTQQYPSDHEIFKDPGSIRKRGWHTFKSIYMDKQDVNLDISRFREVLLKAHEILQSSSL